MGIFPNKQFWDCWGKNETFRYKVISTFLHSDEVVEMTVYFLNKLHIQTVRTSVIDRFFSSRDRVYQSMSKLCFALSIKTFSSFKSVMKCCNTFLPLCMQDAVKVWIGLMLFNLSSWVFSYLRLELQLHNFLTIDALQ